MFKVDNKFEIGQEVFTINQVPIHYKCPVCEGEGMFIHNNCKIRCPKCSGSGKLHEAHARVWEVIKDKCIISSIKVSYNGQNTSIRYKTAGLSRNESNIFETIEKAQERCDFLNKKEYPDGK